MNLELLCPWCGEPTEVTVEPGSWGAMVQDCEVCCRPIHLEVRWDAWGDPEVTAEPAE